MTADGTLAAGIANQAAAAWSICPQSGSGFPEFGLTGPTITFHYLDGECDQCFCGYTDFDTDSSGAIIGADITVTSQMAGGEACTLEEQIESARHEIGHVFGLDESLDQCAGRIMSERLPGDNTSREVTGSDCSAADLLNVDPLGQDPNDPSTQQECPSCGSPIVLDLERNGFSFSGTDDMVTFDIDADGELESLTWTEPSSWDGFLVLDRDGNGTIDSGAELFGNHTVQPETDDPNGFLALRVFDSVELGGNADGWISAGDAIYDELRVWVDENHDGMSQAIELLSMESAGIGGIQLNYVRSGRRDPEGNLLRWISFVDFTDGVRRLAAVDVIFVLE